MQLWVPVILLTVSLSACVSEGGSDPRIHYAQFDAELPKGNRITVCHAYTCKLQTPYTFSKQDIADRARLHGQAARNRIAHARALLRLIA